MREWCDKFKLGKSAFVKRDLRLLPQTEGEFDVDFFFDCESSSKDQERWVGMAIEYSQEMPLDEALTSTFDGSRPCALCKAVKQGREEERKQSLLKPGQEFKGLLHALPVSLTAPCVAALSLIAESAPPVRFLRPPHPPPRGL